MLAISSELLDDILEMVYIANLEGNAIVVTDAEDETESSSGSGGCSNNDEERDDDNSNNGDKNNKRLSAIASAFLAGLFTTKSDETLIHKSIDETVNDADDDDDDLQSLVVEKVDIYAINCARTALRI